MSLVSFSKGTPKWHHEFLGPVGQQVVSHVLGNGNLCSLHQHTHLQYFSKRHAETK